MSNETESAVMEGTPKISSHRYDLVLKKVMLLNSMGEITNKEVKRILSLVESPDSENWLVAEETIINLLSASS